MEEWITTDCFLGQLSSCHGKNLSERIRKSRLPIRKNQSISQRCSRSFLGIGKRPSIDQTDTHTSKMYSWMVSIVWQLQLYYYLYFDTRRSHKSRTLIHFQVPSTKISKNESSLNCSPKAYTWLPRTETLSRNENRLHAAPSFNSIANFISQIQTLTRTYH